MGCLNFSIQVSVCTLRALKVPVSSPSPCVFQVATLHSLLHALSSAWYVCFLAEKITCTALFVTFYFTLCTVSFASQDAERRQTEDVHQTFPAHHHTLACTMYTILFVRYKRYTPPCKSKPHILRIRKIQTHDPHASSRCCRSSQRQVYTIPCRCLWLKVVP